MGNPENLLKGKTAIEKLGLTLQFIPMFSLTAFFRVGSGVPKVRSYKCRRHNHRCYCLLQVMGPYSNSIPPFSPAFFFFIVWIWYKVTLTTSIQYLLQLKVFDELHAAVHNRSWSEKVF